MLSLNCPKRASAVCWRLWFWVSTIKWIGRKGHLQFIGFLGHYFTPGPNIGLNASWALALCWINPVLDLEAFPQASHGEGTFPMGLFSMWYYLIISYLIITFPMCLFLMCTLWHYIFLLFHTLYKPGLCPLLPLAFLRHHQILTRAFIPMWNKKYQTYFLHLIDCITW